MAMAAVSNGDGRDPFGLCRERAVQALHEQRINRAEYASAALPCRTKPNWANQVPAFTSFESCTVQRRTTTRVVCRTDLVPAY